MTYTFTARAQIVMRLGEIGSLERVMGSVRGRVEPGHDFDREVSGRQ